MALSDKTDKERLQAANIAVIRTTALLDAMEFLLSDCRAGEHGEALQATCHFARECANEAYRTLYE